ncbi:MAG: hypothetical protein AB7E51_06700 [Pseudodesulfovibrio sp.]|uniref:hypothetical protein n=1 Tax=Pseudodesulfovibrio sp. TaxID=2035812 RepID=UPI003D14E162
MAPRKIDLTTVSLPDVLQLMVSGSGRSWEEIGPICGWGPANVNRIRDSRQDYWPTLPKLAVFCIACNSTLLIDWLEAQVEIGGVELDFDALDCVGLIESMGDLFKEMGDVARAGQTAISPESESGRGISQREARNLIRELVDVINKCNDTIAHLRPIVGRPGED